MARATAPDSTPLATWSDLAGLFDAAVLAAPKTPGDPAIGGDYPAVGRRPVGYLRRWVTGALWADHLALNRGGADGRAVRPQHGVQHHHDAPQPP